MAGAWHEDGRRQWRRAARRDSCNARRSRAPGGPSGREIWGRDTVDPGPDLAMMLVSSDAIPEVLHAVDGILYINKGFQEMLEL